MVPTLLWVVPTQLWVVLTLLWATPTRLWTITMSYNNLLSRSITISTFLFIMNNLGGNLPILIQPVAGKSPRPLLHITQLLTVPVIIFYTLTNYPAHASSSNLLQEIPSTFTTPHSFWQCQFWFSLLQINSVLITTVQYHLGMTTISLRFWSSNAI